MKKAIALTVIGVMCLALLAGCGSKEKKEEQTAAEGPAMTEEQAAMEEIQQHVMEEAAADGVDLQGMLEQEAAESQARTDAREQEREERQASKEELDEYYNPLLQAEYDALITAVTAEDTIAHGDKYNEILAERLERGTEAGVGCSYAALNGCYVAKALLLSHEQYSGYDSCHVWSTSDWGGKEEVLLLMYEKDNEYGYPVRFLFLHDDFSECALDLAKFLPEGALDSFVMIETVGKSAIELTVNENGGFHYYLFDITGSEAVLACDTLDGTEESYAGQKASLLPGEEQMGEAYEYMPFEEITLDELNSMIVRNTAGAAAVPYAN